MKLLMSKNGGERGESPSLMKNYYKEWESIMSKDGDKRGEVLQQKRIINVLDVKQECYETHLNGL